MRFPTFPRLSSPRESKKPAAPKPVTATLDAELPAGALERFSEAIQLKTVSYDNREAMDLATFEAFHQLLEKSYPLTHARLRRERVNGYSLLFTWKGTRQELNPVLFMSHIDVVPVERGTEQNWTHPPYSGAIADGHVWGRGTLDTKCTLTGVLEGIEKLLAEGFEPDRTILLAFGYDEEIGGAEGAPHIVRLLKSRGIRLEYIVDEGGAVVPGTMFGIKDNIAAVAIAEKGMVNFELSVRGAEGHASMPPRHTASGKIARAITRIERRPFPTRLTATMSKLLKQLGAHMPEPRRALLRNLWATHPLVRAVFERMPTMNALIRTTQAVTVLEGSSKANILPHTARAVVNLRLLHGDSISSARARVESVIDDPEIHVRVMHELGANDAVEPASTESRGFRDVNGAINELFPDAIVMPHILAGATDSRHYQDICSDIYRFAPMRLDPVDLERIHGTDERISIDNYAATCAFFCALVKRSAAA
jgi:carboxypeptidase PM20D1